MDGLQNRIFDAGRHSGRSEFIEEGTNVGLASDECLPELVAVIEAQSRSRRSPGNRYAFSGKQSQKKIPKGLADDHISAHSFDQHHREGSSAATHVAAVIAEYARFTNSILAGHLIEPLPFAMLVKAADDVTVWTRHQIQSFSILAIFHNVANVLCVLGTYIWPHFLW